MAAAALGGGSSKRFIPFLLALMLAGGAVFLINQELSKTKNFYESEYLKQTANLQNPMEIIVLKKDVEPGTTIEMAHLDVAEVPEMFIQPYATQSAGEVLGLVTVTPMAEGEQLMLNKLRRAEDVSMAATLSSLTPEGQRAVTIGADALSGVGGFVRPGDTVDVLWSVPLPEEQGGNVTLTLFQHIKVLAVGSQMMGKSTTDQEASQNYTVTLSLNPQETSVLLYARSQGQVQLSLRSYTDKGEQVAVTPMNYMTVLQSVLGEGAPGDPPAPTGRTVEVYKGLERTVVSLNE